jgi:hypothetical protein
MLLRLFVIIVSMLAGPAHAVITLQMTFEAAGVQSSTAGFNVVGVETFNSRSTGANQSFSTDFGTGGLINGQYSKVRIDGPNQYGSAGGTGNHAVIFGNNSYDVTLQTNIPGGLNYFGFWLSALDANNRITFLRNSTELFTFTPQAMLAAIQAQPNSSSFFGNPNPAFLGKNPKEPYAFVNFFFTGGFFDRIIFSQLNGGGLESDNHTVGRWNSTSGTPIVTLEIIPEPQTWALLLIGFGLVGGAMRRRTPALQAAR